MDEFWKKVFMAAFQVRCEMGSLDEAVNLAAMAANRAVKECPKEDWQGTRRVRTIEVLDHMIARGDALLEACRKDKGDAVAACRAATEPPEPPEEGGWISVKDLLPGIDTHVLTYCSEPRVNPFAVLYYSDAIKSFTSGYNITHWRWLPDPPEATP